VNPNKPDWSKESQVVSFDIYFRVYSSILRFPPETIMEAPNSSDFLDAASSPDYFFDSAPSNPPPPASAQPPESPFQCSCGKAYNSYSALYSHNKQKHNGEKTNLPSGRGGRSRGRPRKNGDPPQPRSKPPSLLAEDNSFFQLQGWLGCAVPTTL